MYLDEWSCLPFTKRTSLYVSPFIYPWENMYIWIPRNCHWYGNNSIDTTMFYMHNMHTSMWMRIDTQAGGHVVTSLCTSFTCHSSCHRLLYLVIITIPRSCQLHTWLWYQIAGFFLFICFVDCFYSHWKRQSVDAVFLIICDLGDLGVVYPHSRCVLE